MSYIEYKPASRIGDLIDCYWMLTVRAGGKRVRKPVFPDGGTELFINTGVSASYLNGVLLQPGHMYLLGTKVSAGIFCIEPDSGLMGIRFKPGAVLSFYDAPVARLVDEVIEYPDLELLSRLRPGRGMFSRFDHYFTHKVLPSQADVLLMVREIGESRGRIGVHDLSEKYHISPRTMQRVFKYALGISPKAYIKIVRFREVLKKLQESACRESLLRIAFDTGYYDHAHLTHEFKRYTGLNPADVMLT
jgi:AraC-like DNA-binding protein